MQTEALRLNAEDALVAGEPLAPSAGWRDQVSFTGVDATSDPPIVRGVVVAEARLFNTPGRGRFTEDSLRALVEGWPAAGAMCAAMHPGFSDDGLMRYLGRIKKPRLSTAVYRRNGQRQVVSAVRGDLHFDSAARKSPHGDLVDYFMARIRSDSDSLSASLMLVVEKIQETDDKGRPLRGKDGEPLPPVWIPHEILGCDLVARGDAVSSLLSADSLDEIFRKQWSRKRLVAELNYDPARDREIERWRLRVYRRRQQQRLDDLLDLRIVPGVEFSKYIDAPNRQKVHDELLKLPRLLLKRWHSGGGRLEVALGNSIRGCPADYIGQTIGVRSTVLQNRLKSADDQLTVLHEIAHSWDVINRGLSSTVRWDGIHRKGVGRLSAICDRTASETFAESFAMHFHSAKTRAALTPDAKDFISRTSTVART